MKIDLESNFVELQTRRIDIPHLVVEALQDELDLSGEHVLATKQFLSTLEVKRIGFNGLKIDNYYEFIFKVDGDKFLDIHSERYEVSTIIDSEVVRIGSPSDFAILVIGCKNPYMKSDYVDNNMYHYISISFSCKETKAAAILQYAQALVNRVLSKGDSYITPDDVFKPESSSDDWDDDLGFNEPSLTELINEFQDLNGVNHISKNDENLFRLITRAYNIKEDLRFISYFRIIEYLASNQKVLKGKSQFSTFLLEMSKEFKQDVVSELDKDIEFDDMVEYIRNTRNVLTHPTAKYKKGTVFYSFKKSVAFQRIVISKLVGFEL
ncbi:hypothetical protein [Aliivibrio fischeri]|uniref:hypothetical protein n=1 Tax=Aliivibrio fischeri TaxID=668 RepID=UPI0012DAEC3E|nr:hypothetical protein [Aliivibrio fischeri]MUJ39716.1 hypothetical protein [Aliivibrio fischeri]